MSANNENANNNKQLTDETAKEMEDDSNEKQEKENERKHFRPPSLPTTPRKEGNALLLSPTQSAAVTIVGGGKRRRIVSGSGASSGPMGIVPPSPPKFASLDEIMQAAHGVSNMALAHEIAVDKDFKLEKVELPPSTFEGAVKSIVHKAFWDAMEEKLRDNPPDYEPAISVFAEIREMLDGILLPQHQRLRQQIEEVLDMEVIRQQVDAETVDVYSYTAFVLNLMSKLCAPVRDADINNAKAKQQSRTDLVGLFREIIRILELMKIDMANFTIQQMRPFIQSQSVEYEKVKFADFLKTQTDGLYLTRLWLDSFVEASSEPTLGATQSPSAPPSPSTPAAILVEAFVSLLRWDDEKPFPETLVMDEERLLHLRDQAHRISLVGAILLVIYNTVGSPIAGLAALKNELKSHIQVLLGPLPSEAAQGEGEDSLAAEFAPERDGQQQQETLLLEKLTQIADQVKVEIEKALASHGFPAAPDAAWESLRGQILGLTAADHPVRNVVSKRLLGFVKAAMTMKAKQPVQIPPGLSGLQKEIVDLVGSFMRIVTHNRAVFGDYYQDIIHTITKAQVTDSSPTEEIAADESD